MIFIKQLTSHCLLLSSRPPPAVSVQKMSRHQFEFRVMMLIRFTHQILTAVTQYTVHVSAKFQSLLTLQEVLVLFSLYFSDFICSFQFFFLV